VPFFATSSGKTLGHSHAITAAVRKITRAPMVLTGKPSLHALRLVARKLGVPMRRVGVVGDDPLVEMIMARRGGAVGFGVTTGMTDAPNLGKAAGEPEPTPGITSHLTDLLTLRSIF
jgi:4-nitrophenyl phosphatase